MPDFSRWCIYWGSDRGCKVYEVIFQTPTYYSSTLNFLVLNMSLLLPSCVWHSDKVKQTLKHKAFIMIVIWLIPFFGQLACWWWFPNLVHSVFIEISKAYFLFYLVFWQGCNLKVVIYHLWGMLEIINKVHICNAFVSTVIRGC